MRFPLVSRGGPLNLQELPGGPLGVLGGAPAGPHDQYSHGRGVVVALVCGCLGGLFKAVRLVSLSEVGAGLSIM